MKYIKLILFITIVNSSFGQWIEHNYISYEPSVCPSPSGNMNGHLDKITMLNDSTGYIIGGDFATPSAQWVTLSQICHYGFNGDFYTCSFAAFQYGQYINAPSNFQFLNEDTIMYMSGDPMYNYLNISYDKGGSSNTILQWSNDTSLLNNYLFFSPDSGILSSYNTFDSIGYIINYSNNNLDTIYSGFFSIFQNIYFVNDSVGFMEKDNLPTNSMELLKTTDSGQSWTTVFSNISSPISDFKFLSDTIGFLTLLNDSIFKTNNQGSTWSPISIDYNRFPGKYEFVTENLWYAVQAPDSLFKTYDGGLSWINDNLNINPSYPVIKDIEIISDSLAYVVANNCKLYTKTLNVNVGLKEVITKNYFNIYPNPTSTQLTIDTKIETVKISIIDITGKIIKTVKQNTNTINVADLPSGIYFIKFITDERIITKKFVKE